MTGASIAFVVTYAPRGGDHGGPEHISEPYCVAPHEGVALQVVAENGCDGPGVSAHLQGSHDRVHWASLGPALVLLSGNVAIATRDDLPPYVRVAATVARADDMLTLSVKSIGGEG